MDFLINLIPGKDAHEKIQNVANAVNCLTAVVCVSLAFDQLDKKEENKKK